MTTDRTPTTVRLSPEEKAYIAKHAGSVQAFIDKGIRKLKDEWTVWEPRLPDRLLPAFSILREIALPVPNRRISLWDALSTLQVELDYGERRARSTLDLLHRWRVIYRKYGLHRPQGYVIVATNEEEFRSFNNGYQVTPSEARPPADTGTEEEGADVEGGMTPQNDGSAGKIGLYCKRRIL